MKLAVEQVSFLENYIRTGTRSVRKVKRAKVLLALSKGETQIEAARQAGVSKATVTNLLRRFQQVNFDVELALEEAPRPGQPSLITTANEAHLTALACSQAPQGHGTWTLRLLRDKAVELDYLPAGTSHETVRSFLKKAGLSPGKPSNGVSGK